jgi:hypothetical protein
MLRVWRVDMVSASNLPKEDSIMTHVLPSRLLRAALLIDAAASGALGVLQVAATAMMVRLLGLAPEIVLGSGLFFLVYAAVLVVLARSATVPRALVMLVAAGNAGWALGCVAMAALYPGLTSLGVGYLLLQAAAVLAFAVLQALGLARSSATRLAAAGPLGRA